MVVERDALAALVNDAVCQSGAADADHREEQEVARFAK